MIRTAVLISGRGTNLRALVGISRDIEYPAQVGLVISNNADALGLEFARQMALPCAFIDHRGRTRVAFEAALHEALTGAGIDLICLAGFMRILTPDFVEKWSGRILNIHPTLLPAFPGIVDQAAVLASGAAEAGCTVHEVIGAVDAGPIIMQGRTAIYWWDTVESLTERILEIEHRIYPKALKLVIDKITPHARSDTVI